MRKILLFMSLLALSFVLVACGSSNNDNGAQQDTPVIEDNEVETNPDTEVEDEADDQGTTPETETEPESGDTQDSTEGDDEVSKMDRLDYVEFELEVQYDNGKEYEVELERKRDDRVQAKIEDELKGVKIQGPEAFDQLYPLVEQLTITQSTSKADAIQEVLSVFELDSNYEEFEVEITFTDGTKIEFEDER